MNDRAGSLQSGRPTHVLAFGKASMGMAGWCVERLGEQFAGGVVLAPEPLIGPIHSRLTVYPADHPTPTPRNIAAASALRTYAESIPADHACIVCVSGGGSAHLCSPRPGVTLGQIVETTRSLNASGAAIGELNKARKGLELLKAGGLGAVLAHVTERLVYVLSDVIGDDLATIASGPMLDPGCPVEHIVIGNHQDAGRSAEALLDARHSAWVSVTGDAQEQGRVLADAYHSSGSTVIIAGETTVDAGGSCGVGGPCIECSLACAQALSESDTRGWMVLGLATDGIDGPTDAAGAIITRGMLVDGVRTALAAHDTLAYLDRIGASFRTGATGTNVNDIVLVTRLPSEKQR